MPRPIQFVSSASKLLIEMPPLLPCGIGANEFMTDSFCDCLSAGGDVESGEDAMDVVLDCGFAETQHLCDFPVGFAAANPA